MRRALVVLGIAVIIAVIIVVMIVVAWSRWRRHADHGSHEELTASTATSTALATTGPRAAHVELAPGSATGRVVRAADGTGIANAVVALAPARGKFDGMGFGDDDDDDKTVVVITNAQGVWSAPRLEVGRYVPTASAVGFVPGAHASLEIATGAHATGIDFSLAAGGTLVHGTVTDIGGGAIADAHITMTPDATSEVAAHYVAIAGTDGTYQLSLPDGGGWHAAATQSEYLGGEHAFEVKGAPVTVDFVLTPGGSIRGRVVTRQGLPVPGAHVTGEVHGSSMFGAVAAKSDDAGNFVLRPVHSGSVELSAVSRGLATMTAITVPLGIGEQLDGVRIVVDRAFAISGVVADSGGHGLPGVHVGAFTMGGLNASAPDATGSNGEFEIIGVRPATYMLTAFSDDAVPEIGSTVEVVDKDVSNVKITLDVGVTLSGTVAPAAVASVQLSLDTQSIGFGNMFDAMKTMLARIDSDASGAFTIHHVPRGKFSLVARAKDGRTGKLPIEVTADRAGLVIPLEPRGSISGRVVDASGAPVVGASVIPASDSTAAFSMSSSSSSASSARTGADGSFQVVGLDAGSAKLHVSDDQGPLAWADAAHRDHPQDPIAIEVAAATAVTGIVLTVEARDGVIRGHVVDATHAPVADAWVTVAPAAKPEEASGVVVVDMDAPSSGRQPVLTGADGAFVIDHLRHTPYRVTAEGMSGRAHASNDTVNPGDDITLTLATLGSLSGTATSAGAPVGVYDLACTGPAGDRALHVTAADGSYQLDRMAPGRYDCTVDADTASAAGTVTITDASAHLDFALGPWSSIVGLVVDANDVPQVGLVVAASTASARSMTDLLKGQGPTTDATGHFLLAHITPGKAELAVLSTTGFNVLAGKDVQVGPGQQVDAGKLVVKSPAPTTP